MWNSAAGPGRSLSDVYPDIAALLVPGERVTADQLTIGSKRRLLWHCKTHLRQPLSEQVVAQVESNDFRCEQYRRVGHTLADTYPQVEGRGFPYPAFAGLVG